MSYGYMHNFGYGFITSGYNPLINYKWTTTLSSGYVTDGIELVTNGGFDSDLSGWTTTSVWSWDNGQALVDDTSGYNNLWQIILEPNTLYNVKYNATAISQGSLRLYMCESLVKSVGASENVDAYFTSGSNTNNKFNFHLSSSGGEYLIDNISVQKVIQEPNKRYFTDSGISPKYPALMASGSGVKFNGVDQYIDAGAFSIDGNQGYVITTFSSPANSTSHKYLFSKMDYQVASSRLYARIESSEIRLGLGSTSHISTGFITSGTHTLVLMYNNGDYHLYIDGVLEDSGTYTGSVGIDNITEIGRYSYSSDSYIDSTINNVVFSNNILTPTQIAYQYNNPEKFLYREDNILKSHTLAQAEIDNVVAFLPMNETDGYVRDLANYSEAENVDTASISVTQDGDGTSILTQLADGFEIETFGDGTIVDRPLVNIPYISGEVTTGDIYYYSYTIETLAGSENIAIGNLYGEYAGRTDGVFSGVEIMPSSRVIGYFLVNGTLTGKVRVSNLSLKKLSGIYPITNYLSTCRTNAQNLEYGRQNALLKRDALGVEYASSFNAMVMDGTQAPAIQLGDLTDTDLGDKFVIEFVISREESTNYEYLIKSDNAVNGIRLYASVGDSRFALRLYGNGTGYTLYGSAIDSDFHHITFRNNGTHLDMKVDGVWGTLVAHSFVPSGLKFSDSTQASPVGIMPMFKIWDEANYDKYDSDKSDAIGAKLVAQHQGV